MNRLLIAACLVASRSPPPPRSPTTGRSGAGRRTTATPPRRASPPSGAPDKNVVWKLKMPGIGASTPCVWGDRIFLTSADGDDDRPAVRRHRRQGEVEADALEHRAKRYRNPSGARSPTRPRRAPPTASTSGRSSAATAAARLLHRRRQAGLGRRPPEVRQVQHPVRLPLDPGALQGPALPPGDAPQRPEGRLPRSRDRQGGVGGGSARATAEGESPDVYASAFIWEGEGGPLLVAHGNDYSTGHKLDRRRGGLARPGTEPDEQRRVAVRLEPAALRRT